MLQQLTELRETLRCFSLLRNTIKHTDGQPDEELQRERSGRVVSIGASVSMELGMYFATPESSQTHTSGIFMGALSHRHGPLLIPFSGLSPSQENGGYS